MPPSHRLIRSCESTPATAMVRPDDVDRNAANAPATSSAASSSPPVPPIIRVGRAMTTESALPAATRSPAYMRPSAPYTGGST